MDYKQLYSLNVNEHTEKKNGLTYLSWAWAWAKILEVCPTATYEIIKDENGIPAFGNQELGYMCYTKVTIEGVTHEMWLPVMDFRNKAIKTPDMFDINKTVMRCLTKNLAMFGLGLYIYAGEDLPNEEDKDRAEEKEMKSSVKVPTIEELIKKAKSKGVTEAQMLGTLNKDTPEKEHVTDIKNLTESQIIGLNKRLDMVKK